MASLEPYHAGVGQLDLQLRARGGLEDRHRDEFGGRGPDGRCRLTRGVLVADRHMGVLAGPHGHDASSSRTSRR